MNGPSWAQPPQQPASPPEAAESLQAKVTRWHALKTEVARLSAEESALRLQIAAEWPAPRRDAGSARTPLGFGKDLKLTTKVNYSVQREALDRLHNQIPEAVRLKVFRWKPEVVAAELEKVADPDVRRALAECVTSKPGLPSLEIVDVKAKGG